MKTLARAKNMCVLDLKAFIEHQEAELICIKIKAFLLLNGITDAHYVKL